MYVCMCLSVCVSSPYYLMDHFDPNLLQATPSNGWCSFYKMTIKLENDLGLSVQYTRTTKFC